MQPHSCQTTFSSDGESQVIEVYGKWMDGIKVDEILRDMDYHPFIGTRYILREESGAIVGIIKQMSSFWFVNVDEKYKDTELIEKAIDKDLISIPDSYPKRKYTEESSFEKYSKLLGIEIDTEKIVLSETSSKGIMVPKRKRVKQNVFGYKDKYEI